MIYEAHQVGITKKLREKLILNTRNITAEILYEKINRNKPSGCNPKNDKESNMKIKYFH